MKRNSPIICVLISLLLWAIAGGYFVQLKYKLQPSSLVKSVQEDVYKQQESIKALLQNKNLMKHLWQNQLSESEFQALAKEEFIIQLYDNAKLSFWNRNDFPVSEIGFLPNITALREDQNVFLYQSFGKSQFVNKRINIIIPVYKHYDVSNEYIKSGFSSSPDIPETSAITFNDQKGATLINSKEGIPLFFIQINANNIREVVPDWILLSIIFLAILSSIICIQIIGVSLGRKYSSLFGIGFMFVIIVAIRLFVYWFGLPFDLDNLDIFSPQIFASNSFLPSFGHFFFHVLCIYWMLTFVISQKRKFYYLQCNPLKPALCWFLFILTILLVFGFGFYLQHLVQSIVINSDISFDTNTFNATDKFTLLALIIIAVIARIFLITLKIANVCFEKTIQKSSQKYFTIITISAFLLIIHRLLFAADTPWVTSYQIQNWLDIAAVFWAVGYLYFIDSKRFLYLFSNTGLFSLIFLSVYFSILFALFFKFYIDEKERNVSRVAFAEKLSRQQDTELELKFDEIAVKIKQDTLLQDWLEYSDSVTIQDVYKHFKLYNSDLYFSKYSEDIFLFKSDKQSLIQNENMPLDSLVALKEKSIPTLNESLFFRVDSSDRGSYLVYIPIIKPSTKVLLGYLCVNFKLKQNIAQSSYPRLLRNAVEEDSKSKQQYNYAIYINNKIANQSGSYNFDYSIKPMPLQNVVQYSSKNDVSEMYYKVTPSMVYVVVYQNKVLVGIITIFSFLFGIFLIIATIENWLNIIVTAWLSGKKIQMIYNASMSVRVKYFALGFTAISFFIIGLSTVIFLTNRYQSSSLADIEQSTSNTSEAIADYLQNQKAYASSSDMEDQIASSEFAFFLTNMAQQQKVDINVFDVDGKLAFTTQDNIYKAKVVDKNLPANAFQILKRKKLSIYTEPEMAGLLQYTASYSPILNHENKLVGYLNIPSFYTKQNLDSQIVSLITTLVNIYTILLLISSIVTFLFINTLTRSLRLVADSLKNVSLKNNKLINWPYNDEIGLLVSEYNKMVATVEKNARSLVLDERQNAWREMAQQVAHEIKNPLTPMKLNIQYLQQAINSNHPDIINLTKRVSSSIIEQIDNLNYIASEFSNFAKMPENKTERIDLKSMLERIVLLFEGNKDLTITHSLPDAPVIVFADKSQMLRIFTNIVQNAVESIPTEDRQGLVDIQLQLKETENAVIIKVKDNGSGIPEDVQHRIFDPYFTTKSSGTGLGLAMTKKIIELWGGTITFESVVDEGTTFLLTVPLG